MSEKEEWQVKYDYKMPDGRVVHCTYEKAWNKLNSGRYGEGSFKEVKKSPRSLDRSLGISKKRGESYERKSKKSYRQRVWFYQSRGWKRAVFPFFKVRGFV